MNCSTLAWHSCKSLSDRKENDLHWCLESTVSTLLPARVIPICRHFSKPIRSAVLLHRSWSRSWDGPFSDRLKPNFGDQIKIGKHFTRSKKSPGFCVSSLVFCSGCHMRLMNFTDTFPRPQYVSALQQLKILAQLRGGWLSLNDVVSAFFSI